jgi:hypothetical protein
MRRKAAGPASLAGERKVFGGGPVLSGGRAVYPHGRRDQFVGGETLEELAGGMFSSPHVLTFKPVPQIKIRSTACYLFHTVQDDVLPYSLAACLLVLLVSKADLQATHVLQPQALLGPAKCIDHGVERL